MRRDADRPSFALAVQYASGRPSPARPRIRRWARAAFARIPRPPARLVLTIRFVDDDEGRALNRDYRGRDYATNVLTFAYPIDDGIEADVVICTPVVEREAAEQRKAVVDHVAHLIVHGTLHAAGFDHETPDDADAMEAIERAALKPFGIADPYAERTAPSGARRTAPDRDDQPANATS